MVKVLVVEDDPDDAILTRAYLEESSRLKFETELAVNPADALQRMAAGGHDICLLDYMLGATDGLTLFAEARELGYARPVILLTGQGAANIAEDALRAGVTDFIEKARVDSPLLERVIQYSLERNRAEQEILALNASLEKRVEERTSALVAANRELEEFSHSVSHDLRAPLRAIISTSVILLEDHAGQLDEEGVLLLNRQRASANRLAALIDDLLRLASLSNQEINWKAVDLTELALEVTEEIGNQAWAIPPKFDIHPGMDVHGDRGLLRAVLQNLVENACKFSPDGANVTIGLANVEGEPAFFVRDAGIGFEMKYADKIFKPFERLVTDKQFEGTGIGLANVSRIVSRHKGKLWAESEIGRGTTVYFTIGY